MTRIRHIAGVTLLEIMLVLAIAAMIIVMSIRYYQSATAGSQTNAIISQIQGIIAASDQLAQPTGTYSSVTGSSIQPLLPVNTLNTPWGTNMTVEGGTNTVKITVPGIPAAVCPLLTARLLLNNHFTESGECTSKVYTYTSNV